MTADDVVGQPVFVAGEPSGHVTGVLRDAPDGTPIGLEVTLPPAAPRFLPWVAVHAAATGIEVASPFLMMESCDPYVARGAVVTRTASEALALPRVWTSGLVGTNSP